MNKRVVSCPKCELNFLSARSQTFCPGCKQMIEPKIAQA